MLRNKMEDKLMCHEGKKKRKKNRLSKIYQGFVFYTSGINRKIFTRQF